MDEKSRLLDGKYVLSPWEIECLCEYERNERGTAPQRATVRDAQEHLWALFQYAASCTARLYKDSLRGDNTWPPFQAAASATTTLYKG